MSEQRNMVFINDFGTYKGEGLKETRREEAVPRVKVAGNGGDLRPAQQ